MTEVVNLNGEPIPSKPVNEDLVDMLEIVLARAKAGEIKGAALALINTDGNISTRWCGGHHAIEMVAGITRLQFDFMKGWGGA